ncbi:MAG: DNA internalization-related competence protein ComEC/Rec2 [Burkholderiales bacterium]
MPFFIILFVAGIALLQQQAVLPPLAWAAALPPLMLLAWFTRGKRWIFFAAMAVCCVTAGFLYAATRAQLRMDDALPPDWEGRDVQIAGVVASLPQTYERSVRFEFDVERVITQGAVVPSHIALTWWGTPSKDGQRGTQPEIKPGERWQLTVRLRRPRGSSNPHGFDYEAWLFERDIRATGTVRPKSGSRRIDAMVHHPAYWIEATRERLRARILQALPDKPYAGVLAALAVGDQRAIPAEQWQTFTRTGVNHLMSISGLHITMVSGLIFTLAYGLWRRSARLVLRLPARKAAVIAGLTAALSYTLLAGFEVPAQRTLYMLVVMAVALWMNRLSAASAVLSVALLVVVLIDPWAVLAAGFWLSFGAVGIILYVSVGRIGTPHWLVTWAHVQWAVTLALMPALLAMFQQVSIISPVANALAIPLVSLVVVPLTLIGMLLPFDWVLQLSHGIMAWCFIALEWMSNLPAAVWQQHAPPGWTVLVAVAGAVILLLPRGFPMRWAGLAGFLPLFLAAPPPLAEGELQLTVLDVGHGLAVAARTRNHALLFDAGPAFGPQADSGNRMIVPYLRAAGVKALDMMIVSHDDLDHYGGASSVLQAMPVAQLLTSIPDLDPLLFEAASAAKCVAGQKWEWDGVRFEMLHPTRESYDDASIKDNNRGCVLRIATRTGAALIPADIEMRAEQQLLASSREKLRAQVLLAPHHGSKTSSIPEFVQAVDPRIVIYPVGYRNRFNHPHIDVEERYLRQGSHVYRTDRDGALTLHFGASDAIKVTPHRAAYRRYWQTPMVGDAVPDAEEI